MMVGDCYFGCQDSLRSPEKGMHKILVVQINRFHWWANGEREWEKFIFPLEHEQEWQPHPVDLLFPENAEDTFIVNIYR